VGHHLRLVAASALTAVGGRWGAVSLVKVSDNLQTCQAQSTSQLSLSNIKLTHQPVNNQNDL